MTKEDNRGWQDYNKIIAILVFLENSNCFGFVSKRLLQEKVETLSGINCDPYRAVPVIGRLQQKHEIKIEF